MNELELIGQIYVWLGIDLLKKFGKIRFRKVLQLFQCVLFPAFLHICALILLLIIIQDRIKRINYSFFLDTLLILLPCVMWWSVYNHRSAIRFLVEFILQIKEKHTQLKYFSKLFIISATTYWSALMISPVVSRVVKHSLFYSNQNTSFANTTNSSCMNISCHWKNITKEFVLQQQQRLMPFLFFILYFSICNNVIKILDYNAKTLVKLNENYDSRIIRTFFKNYLEILKFAEKLAESFSLPLLWFVWHAMCIMSYVFLDILSFKDETYFQIIDIFFETISSFGYIAVLSFTADEIPMRVNYFKEILYNLKTEKVFKSNLDLIDIIDIVLNRETVSMTVFKMIHFDRSFFLKSVAAVVAHSVIYYQMIEMK